MDIPSENLPMREHYKAAVDRVAQLIREKRLELSTLFDEQAQITKMWWDWEQSIARPLSKDVD